MLVCVCVCVCLRCLFHILVYCTMKTHDSIILCSVLVFLSLGQLDAKAQSPQGFSICGCSMPGANATTTPTQICVDGVFFDVDIMYCTRIFSPPMTVNCNTTDPVDQHTTFLGVCGRNGAVLPTDNQKVIDAVFCAMEPFGGNILGIRAMIPNCDVAPNFYCWEITMPRCVQRVGNCLLPCQGSSETKCCIKKWRMCIDPSTGNPVILDRSFNCWYTNEPCTEGCALVDCGRRPGECPECP